MLLQGYPRMLSQIFETGSFDMSTIARLRVVPLLLCCMRLQRTNSVHPPCGTPFLDGLLAPYHSKLRRLKAHVTACLVHLCVEGPSGFATSASRAFAFPLTCYSMGLMFRRAYRQSQRRRPTGLAQVPLPGSFLFFVHSGRQSVYAMRE